MLRSILKIHISLFIISALILVFGCVDINNPYESEQSDILSLDEVSGLANGWHKEKLIRADTGGTIYLPDSAKFEVPPKALDTDTVISVTVIVKKIPDLPGDKHIEFIFEPEGLTFNTPVRLVLSGRYFEFLKTEKIEFYYFNEDTGQWELIDEAYITRGEKIISLDIEHFSRYAAAAQ